MNSPEDVFAATTFILLLNIQNNQRLGILKHTFKYIEKSFEGNHPAIRVCLEALRKEISRMTQMYTAKNLVLVTLASSGTDSGITNLPNTIETTPVKYMGNPCSN